MNETFLIIKNLAVGIKEYSLLKIVPSFVIPVAGFLFGFDSQKIILALMVLIVMDFITGIFAAKKLGEPIRSRGVLRSAYKVATYGLLISAGHLTESIVPGTTYIQEAVTTFLALTEMISIIENVGKMGYAVPQRLLNQLHKWRDDDSVAEDLRVGPPTRRESEIVIPVDGEVHPE